MVEVAHRAVLSGAQVLDDCCCCYRLASARDTDPEAARLESRASTGIRPSDTPKALSREPVMTDGRETRPSRPGSQSVGSSHATTPGLSAVSS